tara:strand:+ start:149 stop:265 length:117 start_codon:yes stop_codon:yes gene_type:complete
MANKTKKEKADQICDESEQKRVEVKRNLQRFLDSIILR